PPEDGVDIGRQGPRDLSRGFIHDVTHVKVVFVRGVYVDAPHHIIFGGGLAEIGGVEGRSISEAAPVRQRPAFQVGQHHRPEARQRSEGGGRADSGSGSNDVAGDQTLTGVYVRNGAEQGDSLPLAQAFVVSEKEQAVLDDAAAQGRAKLIAPEGRQVAGA